MPRKTPDEIFQVERVYEPDPEAMLQALRIVLKQIPLLKLKKEKAG